MPRSRGRTAGARQHRALLQGVETGPVPFRRVVRPAGNLQNGIAAQALCGFLNASREAVEAGTFAARDDSQFCWTMIRVDELGWVKAVNIVADALEALLALETECARRIEAGAEPVNATIGLGAYESPRE